MVALAPIPPTNRVGTYLVAGGSSTNASYGNVSLNLIDTDEDWSDVLAHTYVTSPYADGVRNMHIRCPRGVWLRTDGAQFFNHCNTNGESIPVPGPFHALHVAAGRAGGVRLATGFGTFLAGLNDDGWSVTVYNNGTPNTVAPAGGNALSNWEANPLTQGDGYPDIDDVNDPAYLAALYDDELQNGVYEFAFDGNGGDRSTCMVSNWLYPRLTLDTAWASNPYARVVSSEANCVRETAEWQAPYSYVARYTGFVARVGDNDYLQPDEMGTTVGVFVQGTTVTDYNQALALAPLYRVWVKWTGMKATVGADRMQELLAAGEIDGSVEPPSDNPAVGRLRYEARPRVVGRHR